METQKLPMVITMRIRDILQAAKIFTANTKFKLIGGALPAVEMSLNGILNIHENSIWIANVTTDSFLKARILWEDFAHEFKFVDADKRGPVCQQALLNAARQLENGRLKCPGNTSDEFAIVDLIAAAESIIEVGAKDLIVDRHDYNNYVWQTGGNGKMSEAEHLATLTGSVKSIRAKTYPLWSTLIDMLPEGFTKKEAEGRLAEGCRTVGLDSSNIEPKWEPILPATDDKAT